MGENEEARDVMVEFLLVDVPRAYNAIVEQLFLYDVQGVVSTYHLTILYVSNQGTTTKVKGNQDTTKSCYLTALNRLARRTPAE